MKIKVVVTWIDGEVEDIEEGKISEYICTKITVNKKAIIIKKGLFDRCKILLNEVEEFVVYNV